MTKDEIIEMAKQSGMEVWKGGHRYMDDFDIHKFAKLVAEAEREACAKVCDDIRHYNLSQETDDWIEGTKDCANAIRARGDHD